MNGLRSTSFKAIRPKLVTGLLLLAALAPAASLLVLRFAPDLPMVSGNKLFSALLVIVPLSTFLLTVLLCQSRYRLRFFEDKAQQVALSGGTDPLSKLPNRAYFDGLLENAVTHATFEETVALFVLVVDRLGEVNNTHGQHIGDLLLIAIAERLRRVVHEGNGLGRVGGDRFGLMLADLSNLAQCAPTAHRILDVMTAPFDVDGLVIEATLSIGIALAPIDGNTSATLSQAAENALHRAISDGRNRFAFYDKAIEQKLRLGVTIEDDLRAAIASDGLTIVYQPLMKGDDKRMGGVEALVRWTHPTFGLMSPDDFIPVAEARGLIAPLGEWVLRQACIDARRWRDLRVAVNVSPVQFRIPGFVDTVGRIVKETGMDPKRLDLELTEGVLIKDEDQAENVIMQLRAQGIRMGLDDFGSGYSSLIYLRRFAFDKVKIDKALLRALEPKGEGAIILEHIVSLGHALGLTVTAEGIETQEQLDFLRALGCDELQGYFFAEPVTAASIDKMMAQPHAKSSVTAAA